MQQLKQDAPDDPKTQSKREEHVKQLLEEDKFSQQKCQVTCAINIWLQIQPFVDSEEGLVESKFVVAVQAEPAKICQSSFGHVFCTAIGKTLELEAIEYLGFSQSLFNFKAHSTLLEKRKMSFKNNWAVVHAGVFAVRASTQAMKHVENAQKEQMDQARAGVDGKSSSPLDSNQANKTMEKLEDTLPAILELAWAFNVRDISRT